MQNGVGDPQAIQNGPDFLIGIGGGENADDLHALVGVFLAELLQGGELVDTGAAPGLPEIQNGQAVPGENLLGNGVAVQVGGVEEKFRGEGNPIVPPQGKLPDVDLAAFALHLVLIGKPGFLIIKEQGVEAVLLGGEEEVLVAVLVRLQGFHIHKSQIGEFPLTGKNQLRLDGDIQLVVHADLQPEIVDGLHALPGALVGKGEIGLPGADTDNAEIMGGRGAHNQLRVRLGGDGAQILDGSNLLIFGADQPGIPGAGVAGKAHVHAPLGFSLIIGAGHRERQKQGGQQQTKQTFHNMSSFSGGVSPSLYDIPRRKSSSGGLKYF